MNKLNYALLLIDQTEEDQINYSLRKCGASVNTYRSLNELWESLFTATPNAVVVDIRLFNNEERFLKDHPLIMDSTVSLILFFRDSDGPILKNLNEKIFYDYLKMSPSYDQMCRHINHRLQLVLKLEKERVEYAQKLEAREKELQKFQHKFFQVKSEEAIKTVAYLFTKRFFHQLKITKNFLAALSQTLEDFSFVESYMLFEVDREKQKIKTANLSKKSRVMPNIFIEESLTNSYFKGHVVKTCDSIVNDTFGYHSKLLKLEALPGSIRYILGFKVSSNYVDHVDVEYISRIISAELQRSTSQSVSQTLIKPIHELLPFADRIKRNVDHRNVIYQIDLGALKNEINNFGEFSFQEFFNDLVSGINQAFSGQVSIYTDGLNAIYLMADYSLSRDEATLFLDRFMTWSYFDTEESSIGKLIDFPMRQLNLKESCLEKILGVGNEGMVNQNEFIIQENLNAL